jgi:serine/threonine protein kinase
MHDMGLVHGDVKPENCFLSGTRGNEVLVLGDFGLTRAVGEGQRGLIGTIDYRAPEIFEGAWGLGVDVWAFGVTIYAALANRRPFPADSDTSQRAHFQHMITIRASRFNSWWLSEVGASVELVDLLRHLLVRDVCARYTIHQALNHPWFQGTTGGG